MIYLFFIFLLIPFNVQADKWPLPETKIYYSNNLQYKFTVIPRSIKSVSEPAKTRPGGNAKCLGSLEVKTNGGSYTLLWQTRLTNDVSPVDVLISNSGQYVATFDNWHRLGYGPNAVVIYGQDGHLIRELSLEDFLAKREIDQLPKSVSSIMWGRNHYFDESETFLILRVFLNKDEPLLFK